MDIESVKKINNKDSKHQLRINRFLSAAGVCSRRQADKLIEEGRVTINGRRAVIGDVVLYRPAEEEVFSAESESPAADGIERHEDIVMVDGARVVLPENRVLLAFNKPAGIECTADPSNPDNIIDFINFPERIFTIGRLDKNSTGLILLTNDGILANEIARSRNEHEKEYIVKVDKDIDAEFPDKMRNGIFLEELKTTTKKCFVKQTGNRTFHIILTQGLNRQIRRMCRACGYEVVSLHRIRIMNILLGNLAPGEYRSVSKAEQRKMLDENNHEN